MNEIKKALAEKTEYTFDDLLKIMELLRAPGGCPWDREQTHKSIRKNFIEEAYEVAEAIDEESQEHLCEELGDVMLQVVFHTEMEKEKGSFTIDDVIGGICKKLVRRHPHIFGEASADTPDKVLANWDEIKAKEKKQSGLADELDGISKTLPSLVRAQKMIKKASKHSVDLSESTVEFKGFTRKEYADKLALLAASANENGIDLEEVLEEKCNLWLKTIKNS
jgi:tetrapyrrole methylase family protein/MazG family protein